MLIRLKPTAQKINKRNSKMIESIEEMDDEHIDQASRAMKAMSHPLRLKILCVLADQEVSVQDIVERVGTTDRKSVV